MKVRMRKQQRDEEEEEEWCGGLDLEYLEQWHLWHVGMKHDLSDLLVGIDEDEDIIHVGGAKEDQVFSASSDAKKNTQEGNSGAIAIPATNAMAGGQDTIDRHNSMRNASTVALLDSAPARKDSTKSKLLKRKTTTVIPDSSSAIIIKKSKTMTMRPKDDITCPSADPQHPGPNCRHTAITPKSHTDCNRKKARNVPSIRQAAALLNEPAATGDCKMMTAAVHHTVPTNRQAKPEAESYGSRLGKAKEKLHDRYMKANQRRSTQLMDFRNLPTPAQGSCQRIYKATTTANVKKLNSTKKLKVLNRTRESSVCNIVIQNYVIA